MYPIIPLQGDEQRRDLFLSWRDRQPRLDDDPLVERAFYASKNEQHGLYAGTAQLRAGGLKIDAFAADLFLVVTAGLINLRLADGEEIGAAAGESLVIPRGARLYWRSEAATRVWFVAYQPEQVVESGAGLAPFRVNPALPLERIDGPAAELIVSAQRPDVFRSVVYQSADGKFSVGIWQATAYTRSLAAFGDYELMYPLQGEIALSNALGETQTFGPGQGVIVNRGVGNAWHSSGVVKKIYSKISV